MRRLVKHGIAGLGFAAFTVTAAVAALGSPAAEDVAMAVPAVVAPAQSGATTASATETALAVERTARESRDAQRATLSAAAQTKAGDRAATLIRQSKAIAAQQSKLQGEQARAAAAAKAKAKAAQARAKAAAKAKADAAGKAEGKAQAAAVAAAEAKQRALQKQGYQPGTSDPRAIARQILKNKFGYGDDQYSCYNYIIMRESMWKVNATNPSSGAYGIPQALPGSKMASAGSDWRTNPATQILWSIGYMKDRYGSPCEAKTFKAANGWY